jgi:hypothetical protein
MLDIETFDQLAGGQSFFKAIGHPLAAQKVPPLMDALKAQGPVAVYDPQGWLTPFCQIHPLTNIDVTDVYVQRFEDIGQNRLGHVTQPVTQILETSPKTLFIVSFDEELLTSHLTTFLPRDCRVFSLKDLKLPPEMLTNTRTYLDPLNFATNFAFFRDEDNLHTRLATANYWTSYSGKPARVWCHLLDTQGLPLVTWDEHLTHPGASFVLDSKEIRKRFGLDAFCGQLFLHVVGAAGHDIVKYGLDIYSDDGRVLSCTHDANAWPAQYYAGLPAPTKDEDVILWVQNSHPCPIPGGAIKINLMGREETAVTLDQEVAPFATLPVSLKHLMPGVHWPAQLEILAGKHFVRPRYEVIRAQTRRIAHANVERTNLTNDTKLKDLAPLFGKGFLLPAPILPWDRWQSEVLPTPMARSQQTLPVTLLVYGADGHEMGEYRFGCLKRSDSVALIVNDVIKNVPDIARKGYGHMELVYDFEAGYEVDGWLHALFRYESNDHQTESSFGAHIYNTALTYKTQPHSYRGAPPGLTTRLFLPTGATGTQAVCHLIYPVSTSWHPLSNTDLILHNAAGEALALEKILIPCGGSRFWTLSDIFSQKEIQKAGENAYVIIRDTTCRLFGYHGLQNTQGRLCLDHMFGF